MNEILPVLLMAAKYDVAVCPHAGGVGLWELVPRLSMVDYVCVSGSIQGRVIEYVEHLHEHFTDPVQLTNAHYQLPAHPGYNSQLLPESVADHRYPDGECWRRAAGRKE